MEDNKSKEYWNAKYIMVNFPEVLSADCFDMAKVVERRKTYFIRIDY